METTNETKIDPRPRCIGCGRRWVPVEGEDATIEVCDVCGLTVEAAAAKISTEVYKATSLFEHLETAGHMIGNGHHMRQLVATFAADLMRERWKAKG